MASPRGEVASANQTKNELNYETEPERQKKEGENAELDQAIEK